MQLVDPRPARPLPIRLTPLIDVVFILLVFFMLTTRLLPVEHLALDNTTPASGSATGEPVPELMLHEDGTLAWRQRRLPVSELIRALSKAGIAEVNLKAAAQASLSDFTTSLSALKTAGIEAHWERSAGRDTER